MAPDSALATEIINSVSCLLKDETLADFTVEIDETYFRCHRFILGACSRFFYAMFTSDMKEKKENSARLHEIDLSAFDLILKVLYTGENVFNEENVISIWQTAHRLQITFLVSHCEKFATSVLSLENYAEFYRVAKLLDSKLVLGGLKEFMLKNFRKVKEDDFFLELSADELIELIQSDDLVVSSEDDVLISLFKWVQSSSDENIILKSENESNNSNFQIRSMSSIRMTDDAAVASNVELQPKTKKNVKFSELLSNVCTSYKLQNRSVHLQSLLKASRSCIVSHCCLKSLYDHSLTQSDEGAKKIIFDAILYQGKGDRHGYFPPAAMHRKCSEFEHVGVVAHDTGFFQVLSLTRNKMYPMNTCREIKNKIKLALFDSSIYAIGPADDSISKLCVLKESTWTSIAELPGLRYFLLSHKTFLYLFNASNGEVLRINPNSYDKSPQNFNRPEDITHAEFALSFNEYIIMFSKDSHSGKEETAVHVMNYWNETWRRVKNLDGPANKMVSFEDGDKTYVLQKNGNLWSLSIDNEQMIAFHFIKKLWDAKECLRGALLYKEMLFLYYKSPQRSVHILASLPGLYKSLIRWEREAYSSNFICTVVHNQDLIKK